MNALTTMEIIIDGVPGVWTPHYAPPEAKPPAPTDTVRRWTVALMALSSRKTTGAWGKSNGGRYASEVDVGINLKRLTPSYVRDLAMVAGEVGVPTACLLAISCRESNHGAALDSNGEGDHGNGFGCLQVDRRYHEVQGRPDPFSIDHLRQGAAIFVQYLAEVEKAHPDWADEYTLKGGFVAYNSGVSNVQTIGGMDRGTTDNDYGADTAARAQMYMAKYP